MRRATFVLVLLLLAFLCAAPPARGITYYVSPPQQGGNDGNNCPPDSPNTRMATINKGLSCLHPGDKLIIGTGTYDEILMQGGSSGYTVPSGNPGSPITIQSETQYGAKIARTFSGPGGYNWTIFLIGVHDVIFDGLDIDNTRFNGPSNYAGGVTCGDCVNVTFQNMDIHGGGSLQVGGSTTFLTGASGATNNLVFKNNKIHDAGTDKLTDTNDLNGPHDQYGSYIHGTGIIYDGNEFYSIAGYAIHYNNSDPLVPDCVQTVCTGDIFRNNYFHDIGTAAFLFNGVWVQGAQIINNVIVRTGLGQGWRDTAGIVLKGNTLTNFVIANNTMTGSKDFPGNSGQGPKPSYPITLLSGSNTTIWNNVLYGNMTNQISDGGTGTSSHQNTEGSPNPALVDITGTTGTSCVQDIPHSWYRGMGCTQSFQASSASSPMINQGDALGSVFSTDIGGFPRPEPGGTLWDRGAWEYGSAAAAVTGAWWKFDETSGFTAADASNNGHTGTLTTGATHVTGRVGPKAVQFTPDDKMTASQVIGTGQYSWWFWLKCSHPIVTGTNVYEQPFLHGDESPGFGFSWSHDDPTHAQALFHYRGTGGHVVAQIPPLTDPLHENTWYHIASTWDSTTGTVKIFLNGIKKAQASVGAPRASIGNVQLGTAACIMDDVHIEPSALTDADMLKHFQETASLRGHRSWQAIR